MNFMYLIRRRSCFFLQYCMKLVTPPALTLVGHGYVLLKSTESYRCFITNYGDCPFCCWQPSYVHPLLLLYTLPFAFQIRGSFLVSLCRGSKCLIRGSTLRVLYYLLCLFMPGGIHCGVLVSACFSSTTRHPRHPTATSATELDMKRFRLPSHHGVTSALVLQCDHRAGRKW
jgi:hypothetical protein